MSDWTRDHLKNGVLNDVNRDEVPSDEGEVQRLLRESRSLGADSSLWLRAMRQLTMEGKPLGETFIIQATVKGYIDKAPIGMFTITEKPRLVFWPLLPRTSALSISGAFKKVPDHVTVDLSTEQIHTTSYDSNGKSIHEAPYALGSIAFGRPDFRLLFDFHIQMKHVLDQDVLIGREFQSPPSDVERRSDEIAKFRQRLRMLEFPVQAAVEGPQYVSVIFYRTDSETTQETLPQSLFPKTDIHEVIAGWPDNLEFPMKPASIEIRGYHFCIAVACAPGRLIDDLYIGMPARGSGSSVRLPRNRIDGHSD